MCDPPSGWKYGFPKPIPEEVRLENRVIEWLLEEGYPQHELDACGDRFYCRYCEEDIDMSEDNIVLEELKKDYLFVFRLNKDYPDWALLNALDSVISYYSTHEEYKEWMVEKTNLKESGNENRT